MKAVFLAAAVLATAGVVLYFGSAAHGGKAIGPKVNGLNALASQTGQAPSLQNVLSSLPMYFEPNQGQTAPQVKFLARGAGYGLFLTADEAVLQLQHPAARGAQHSARSSQPGSSSVIRMRLEGANASAAVSGAAPLPGKTSYFIGNDPSKWHRDVPQFAQVQYQAVYPGIDLVYYGDQQQLEYDFRVAPAADPNQIAMSFQGASARIDAAASGDLVLATGDGEVHFHAPRVYQQDGKTRKTIPGGFRQLADNKIGFTLGDYDRSRELVIDPILTYSTYLGGTGTEGFVKVAVDSALNIYLAGSTNSTDFPLNPATGHQNPAGSQEIFISKIYPPNFGTGNSQLVYSIILGGTGVETDTLAGIAVDNVSDIYVAGTTTNLTCSAAATSSCFPTTSNNAFQNAPAVAGTHGFVSVIGAVTSGNPPTLTYTLDYSTYLSGNGSDTVTGMTIDNTSQNTFDNVYVTGTTTSNNVASDSDAFPASPAAYQIQSNAAPGLPQYFASKINPNGQGPQSMKYSTYFGGGNFAGGTQAIVGGGIAVDPTTSGNPPNMYITGTTNMLQPGANGSQAAGFPLLANQQGCLNEASVTNCNPTADTNTDGFVAKFNPTLQAQASLLYSTYIGGSGSDAGNAITVDSQAAAYVTGSTNSGDWVGCNGIQCTYNGGANGNAFVAKIGNQTGTGGIFPLTYFTYLGGTGPDSGQAILVDSAQGIHVAGNTDSPTGTFPNSTNSYSGDGDAFVVLISTTVGAGNSMSYLGGSGQDQGTGIALDTYSTTYVAGNTQSSNFPVTPNAYQGILPGPQAAFVSKFGAVSNLTVTQPVGSPSPTPVPNGTQVQFTFGVSNSGPDPASVVNFYVNIPQVSQLGNIQARVSSGGSSGTCNVVAGSPIVSCTIPTLAVCTTNPCTTPAEIQVDVTPVVIDNLASIAVSGYATANNGQAVSNTIPQTVNVTDFNITVSAPSNNDEVAGGPPATIQVTFCPKDTNLGFSSTITPSQTTSPTMVTATAPTFSPTSVTLAGSQCLPTTLSIQTVPRPQITGSLLRPGSFHRSSFYAAWLPIGGLSLVGLGIGVGRKRRRWLAGAVLGLIAGVIVLQLGCGSSSSSTTPTGGTAAGTYTITVTGTAGAGDTHSQTVTFTVK